MSKVKAFIAAMLAVTYAVLLIIFSGQVSESVHNSVMTCLTSLIPSLFAFMVIADFITVTNIYVILSKPFDFFAQYIFRIPTELFSVYLLSQFVGFPVGAQLISSLYKQDKIDKATAENMLGYCFLAGPAFICGIAGINLFGSVTCGMIIFTCLLITNLIVGVLLALKKPIPPKSKTCANDVKVKVSVTDLTVSVVSAAKGMFSVCVMVVFFSSFKCILDCIGVIPSLSTAISHVTGLSISECTTAVKSILEISSIKDFTRGNILLLPIITALLSFGGLCVIMQVESFTGGILSTKNFYFGRILSIFISYSCGKICIGVLDKYNILTVMQDFSVGYRQISPIPSVFLLIMTILLLSNNYIANLKDL